MNIIDAVAAALSVLASVASIIAALFSKKYKKDVINIKEAISNIDLGNIDQSGGGQPINIYGGTNNITQGTK